jgi:hypothetical protein
LILAHAPYHEQKSDGSYLSILINSIDLTGMLGMIKDITDEYRLHDERGSGKLEGLRLRRICLKARDAAGKKQVFTIVPSGVMPYEVG